MIKLLNIAHIVLKEQRVNENFKKKALAATLAAATTLGSVDTGTIKDKPELNVVATKKKSLFSNIDLSIPEGIEQYAKICQDFIDSKASNFLGIKGDMMARIAADVFRSTGVKVPPELALAQLAVEGGIGNADKNIRPIKNNNPYNIGNVDSGKNRGFDTVEDAIKAYYKLIATDYLSGKSPNDLLSNFVNKEGNRYASAPGYESMLKSVIQKMNDVTKKVTK